MSPARRARLAPCGREDCRFASVFALLGKAHVIDILYVLSHEGGRPTRFTVLQRRLGLHPKILTATLREMETFGVVLRVDRGGARPRVEYSIPGPLLALSEPIETLHQVWDEYTAELNLAGVPDPRRPGEAMRHAGSNATSRPAFR
jgi:DNA-binding HxlR family transcriptional regulator